MTQPEFDTILSKGLVRIHAGMAPEKKPCSAGISVASGFVKHVGLPSLLTCSEKKERNLVKVMLADRRHATYF